MSRKKRSKAILVACGMYRYPEPTTIDKILKLLSDFTRLETGYDVGFNMVTASAVPDMRGDPVNSLVLDKNISHILFIDDDMDFPVGSAFANRDEVVQGFNPLERLMSHDRDVIGALCFSRDRQLMPYIGMENDDGICANITEWDKITSHDPFQVDFIGFGMVLVKRRVFEKIMMSTGLRPGDDMAAMFRSEINWRYGEENRKLWAHAIDQYEQDLRVKGDLSLARERLANSIDFIQQRSTRLLDDYSFCRRARHANCEIWCDPSFDVHHIGRYPYGRPDWMALNQPSDGVESEATEGVG